MPVLANFINIDLSKGFTTVQVAQEHHWPEPMVWSLALEGNADIERFKKLGSGGIHISSNPLCLPIASQQELSPLCKRSAYLELRANM